MNSHLVASELKKLEYHTSAWHLFYSNEMPRSDEVNVKVFQKQATKNPIKLCTLAFSLLKEIRKEKPDVIVGFQPFANILGALISSLSKNTKFIATQRNPSSSQGKIIRIFELLVGSTNLYAKNIAVSNSTLASYNKYPKKYKKKMEVIHNGLPPLCNIPYDKEHCRKLLSLPVEVFLIGNIGRIDHQKNPLFLLDVLSKTPANIHLVLAGTGPYLDQVKEKANKLGVHDRIHLPGLLLDDKIPALLKSLDIFLFPSLFEGFGRALIESMQFSLPIIANDIDVTREVTGGAALLCPLNPEVWSHEILRVYSSREVRHTLSSMSKLRLSNFALDSMINKYSKSIAACISKHHY